MKVIKRNGEVVDFDSSKIVNAITKANNEVFPLEERITEKQIDDIVKTIEKRNDDRIGIEVIQNIIEKEIVALNKYELVKAYMIYRYKRALVRQSNTTDKNILSLVNQSNKEVMEENSNKNAAIISTQRDLIAGEVSKDIATRLLLPEKISKAHEEGVIHFHDKDYFLQKCHNCCLINIGDMLDNGTVMNNKLIESPKSFQVACTVMTQIIAAVASSQYGGQSVNIKHLGKYLRKSYNKYLKHYIEKGHKKEVADELATDRMMDELKSGVQTIQYQINTLMTTNGLFRGIGRCKIS